MPDNGKAVLPAEPVGDLLQAEIILFRPVELPPVHEGDGVDEKMIMDMRFLVNVCRNDHLVP